MLKFFCFHIPCIVEICLEYLFSERQRVEQRKFYTEELAAIVQRDNIILFELIILLTVKLLFWIVWTKRIVSERNIVRSLRVRAWAGINKFYSITADAFGIWKVSFWASDRSGEVQSEAAKKARCIKNRWRSRISYALHQKKKCNNQVRLKSQGRKKLKSSNIELHYLVSGEIEKLSISLYHKTLKRTRIDHLTRQRWDQKKSIGLCWNLGKKWN